MEKEIERKFLVKNEDYKKVYHSKYHIIQGFLNKDRNRTVRVRIKNDKAFITVKGLSSSHGLSRLEWEKEIDLQDGQNLLQLCEQPLLHKTRYEVKVDGHIFEVDEFHNNHQGLVIAEIELNAEDEEFTKPDWLGKEVTGNIQYYNSQL
jgi:CYTH domain-containing protein